MVLVAVLVVLVAVASAGVYLERELRQATKTSIEEELLHHGRMGREVLRVVAVDWTPTTIDPIADRLGAAVDARVTVIAAGGEVVGDSERTLDQLRTVENHADRPEVVAALRDGWGADERRSATVGEDMSYVAVAFDGDRGPGRGAVIRVAMTDERRDAAIAALRVALFAAGLVAVAIAVAITFFLSGQMSRQLRGLVDAARAARSEERLPASAPTIAEPTGDARRASSISGLAGELEATLRVLAVERDRFHAVLKSMDEAVLAIDADRRIIAANRAAQEMLSLRGEVVGRGLLEVTRTPELADLAFAALAGTARTTEFVLHGSRKTILARARPNAAPEEEGGSGGARPAGAVLVLHDVTDVRRLETVRQDFVANVSHELRTPVSIIRAHTETLLDGAVDDPVQARAFLEPIRRAADRLGQLIADLLDISRIDRGKYDLEEVPVEVGEVVALVCDSVAEAANSRRVALEIEVADGCRALGDRRALEQILVNLVVNAITYGPEGGRVGIAASRIDAEPARVRLEVSDEGPGIALEHRTRVFERFYRVDPGRSRAMGGTGLGLAIVKNLAEAMGAEVGVDARSPRGSVFWVSMRAAPRSESVGTSK